MLVACLLTSCFSVALSACVANVARHVRPPRERWRSTGCTAAISVSTSAASKQSEFGTQIAGRRYHVGHGISEMDDDKTSQNKGPGSRHYVSGVRVYVRKVRVTRNLDGESTGSRHSFRQGICTWLCTGTPS